MKTTLALLLLITSFTAFARNTIAISIDDTVEGFCPDYKMDTKNDIAYCKASNAKEVIKAKVGAALTDQELKALGFEIRGAIDVHLVPDADSDIAYFYTRWLVNSAGKKVGIITIEGWFNTEMDASERFDVRYNLKGQAVMVSSHDM